MSDVVVGSRLEHGGARVIVQRREEDDDGSRRASTQTLHQVQALRVEHGSVDQHQIMVVPKDGSQVRVCPRVHASHPVGREDRHQEAPRVGVVLHDQDQWLTGEMVDDSRA